MDIDRGFKIVGVTQIGATILHPNTKVLVLQGLFVFSRKKRLSFTVAPFIESYGLEPLTCFIVLTEQMFCDKIYILYIHCTEGVSINDIGRIK